MGYLTLLRIRYKLKERDRMSDFNFQKALKVLVIDFVPYSLGQKCYEVCFDL